MSQRNFKQISDRQLVQVNGGERHQVTLEEYERILAAMIAAANKKKP